MHLGWAGFPHVYGAARMVLQHSPGSDEDRAKGSLPAVFLFRLSTRTT